MVCQFRDHPLTTYAKFSEKLTFLTPRYAHVRVRIRRLEMFVFWKIFRTYLMDDPLAHQVHSFAKTKIGHAIIYPEKVYFFLEKNIHNHVYRQSIM